ncbi:glycosyl transferase [Brucella gallinifaecis]|uniref:Glycosyl transferase n=1 Tax=Brucella gallinifaecis TaxID=215590 RepID=A0A502BSE4_9HYPH|nr:glycosyl transferase [Brucella gallinifaecis]TPF76206.1 glycosyl transferase [Brucella gallinifaecis]
MLSIFIFTHNSEKQLAYTLSALVPVMVDGLLRRVAIIDQDSTDNTCLAAQGAGCAVYQTGELSQALAGLRTEWLLIVPPGATLAEGWEDSVRRHMQTGSRPARFTLPVEKRFAGFAKLFVRAAPLEAGLLVKVDAVKSSYQTGAEFQNWLHTLKPLRLPQLITPPEMPKGGA